MDIMFPSPELEEPSLGQFRNILNKTRKKY